jgi:hypothetical protein
VKESASEVRSMTKRQMADVILTDEKTKASDSAVAAENPPDAAQARENVKQRVRRAAGEIAEGLITAAKDGQLAQAKYLFEMAGLHPATEEAKPRENSLAYILLKRLGLPTEPLGDEDLKPEAVARVVEAEDVASGIHDEVASESCSTERANGALSQAGPAPDITIGMDGHEC